jgi:hypothetical protein
MTLDTLSDRELDAEIDRLLKWMAELEGTTTQQELLSKLTAECEIAIDEQTYRCSQEILDDDMAWSSYGEYGELTAAYENLQDEIEALKKAVAQ